MNIASFVVVYVIAFWLTFFMVLPIGVRRDDAPIQGNDRGAPVKHMIGKKMLWAALAAAVLTAVFWVLVDVLGFSIVD
jgi:predicted secreted protein